MNIGKVRLIATVAGTIVIAAQGISRGSAVPITYQVENRSISASSSATGFPRNGTTSAPVTNTQNQSQQSSGMGDFNESVTADSDIGPQSAAANATSSQNSSLGDSGFSASGSVIADTVFGLDGPANASSNSVFKITFSVAQAESFKFTADMNGAIDLAAPGNTSASVQLTDGLGNNIFSPITSVNVSGFTTQGTLAAGTYVFDLNLKTSSDDENKNFVNYNIAFTDGATDSPTGTGGTVTNPVPLPSSGVGAAAMLLGLGAYSAFRRRLPGWVRTSMI